jgi:two-component system NtrC family sensor kinase
MTKWTGTLLSRLPGAQAAKHDPERSLVWLRVAIVLAAVLPMLFSGGIAWLGYKDSIGEAQRGLEDIARAAEEHAARVMERNDVVMQQMLRLLKDDDDARIRAREAQLHEVAMAILLRFPDIRSLSVWSRDGRLLVSTLFFPVPQALEATDWEYFRWGGGPGSTGSLTRGLLADRATGEALFRVTKQRESAYGEAGGAIELAFSPSYFNESYRRLTERRIGVSVALVNSDGLIVGSWPRSGPSEARLPEGSLLLERMKASEPRGAVIENAFAPGDRRFAAFRKVGNHPLFVATAQDASAVFADWKRQMLVLGAILSPITLALVFASWLVLRRTRREIEARRRLSEEAKQRSLVEESLRHAQRLDALGQLAGGLAHDFNNLLNVVSNSAELLARIVPEAAARPELASIMRAADGGTKLTRRLLAFSRKQALRPEVVAMEAALDGMLDLLRTTAGAGVIVHLNVDTDAPAIEVDAAELEIALINLVANARDAMRHAGRVEIRARRARPGEGPDRHPLGYAVISVCDSGDGMSAETLNRAFEPFFTTKPAGSGTGLGLSQVFAFCAQCSGTVEITSTLRVGTTVSMFLPVGAKALPAATPARPMASLSARVLLVEHDRNVSSILTSILEEHGCVVTSVGSARDAERIILVANSHFDAVLSDAPPGTPEVLAFVSRLRRRRPDLPVVLMSGYSSPVRAADEVIGALSKAISAHRPAAPMH